MTDLSNKIVLITGASSGIGLSCAKKFADKNAKLILIARRIERLEKLVKEIKCDCHILQLDIRNHNDVSKVIDNLPPEWKNIDVLINNAGLGRGLDKLHEGNTTGWDEMIDTNIKGLLYVSRAVIPLMVKNNRGHIINIGSIAGHEVYPGGNVYCATKHAVNALTKGMRLDLVDKNIRVSTIDPGLVETEFSEVRFYGDKDKAKSVYKGYKPLNGDDIADTALWIASRRYRRYFR